MTTAPELFDPEVLQRCRPRRRYPRDYARRCAARRGARRAAYRFSGLMCSCRDRTVLAPPLGARDADIAAVGLRPAMRCWLTPHCECARTPVDLGARRRARAGELPVGAQLVGPPGADEELLAVAHTVELAVADPDQFDAGR